MAVALALILISLVVSSQAFLLPPPCTASSSTPSLRAPRSAALRIPTAYMASSRGGTFSARATSLEVSPAGEEVEAAEGSGFDGEWIGYEAEYRMDGSGLVKVPDYLLPPDLVEWEVEVRGYEHLTSSRRTSEGGLEVVKKRLMPSCGCGVDAVPIEKSEVRIPPASSGLASSASQDSSGGGDLSSYGEADSLKKDSVWGFFLEDGKGKRLQIESSGNGRTLKARIEERVRDFEGGDDYWEIFRDAGFLKRMRCFPELDPPTSAADLAGEWTQAIHFVKADGSSERREATVRRTLDQAAEGVSVWMPAGVTFGGREEGGGGTVETGGCYAPGQRVAISREYQGGVLSGVRFVRETRV